MSKYIVKFSTGTQQGKGTLLPCVQFQVEAIRKTTDRDQWLRQKFAAAEAAGAGRCGVFDEADRLLSSGTLEEVLNFLLFDDSETTSSMGLDLAGNQTLGGNYYSLFEGGQDVSILSVPLTKLPGEKMEKARRDNAVRLMIRHQGADVVLPKADHALVFYWGEGWLESLKNYTVKATNKVAKRFGSLDRPFPFVGHLEKDQVVVKIIESLDEKNLQSRKIKKIRAKLVDGLLLVDRDWAIANIFKAPQPLNMERELRKAEEMWGGDIPQSIKDELFTVASRKREAQIKDAMSKHLGSIRALDPAGPMDKGNYLLVPGLRAIYGCDILLSEENRKSDVVGKDLPGMKWHIGMDPQKVHTRGIRTSTQAMIACQPLFPADQVKTWMTQEFLRLFQMLTSGQMEEDTLQAMEEERDEMDKLPPEVSSLLSTFRTSMESLLEAGNGMLDFRFTPTLFLKSLDVLFKRMVDPAKCRISVPIPHSMSCQMISETLARLAGWEGEKVAQDEVTFWMERGVAICSDDDIENTLEDLGGADFDDHMYFMLVRDCKTKELRVAVIRYPVDQGEYLLLKPKTEKDVALFKARPKLSMKADEISGTFTWSSEEVKEIREVDFSKFPERFSSRLARGDARMVKDPILESKREYPNGYTLAEALKDLEVAQEGFGPGLMVNLLMTYGLTRIPRTEYRFRMEGIIDLMVQGGSYEAKQRMQSLTGQMVQQLLTHLMEHPEAERIDRAYWSAKGIQLPKECKDKELLEFVKAEGHLKPEGEGWLSELLSLYHGTVARINTLARRWVQVWQQEDPSWARMQIQEPKRAVKLNQAVGIGGHYYKAMVLPHWEVLKAFEGGRKQTVAQRLSRKAAQTEFVKAFIEMVKKYGATAISARVYRGRDGVINDVELWNGDLIDVVIKYYQGRLNEKGVEELEGSSERHLARMPHLADVVSFRLIHMDERCFTRWIQQLIRSNPTAGAEARKYLESLRDRDGYFKKAIEDALALAFSPGHLSGFKAHVNDESELKDNPVTHRLKMVLANRDKGLRVLEALDGEGDGPSTPPPPPTPPEVPPTTGDEGLDQDLEGIWETIALAADEAEVVESRLQKDLETRQRQEDAASHLSSLKEYLLALIDDAVAGNLRDDWDYEDPYIGEAWDLMADGRVDDVRWFFKGEITDARLAARGDRVEAEFEAGLPAVLRDVEGHLACIREVKGTNQTQEERDSWSFGGEDVPVEEPVAEGQALGERLKALHQELDQEILKYELAANKLFTPPSAWVKWLERKLEGQEVPAMVLREMVQVSQERVAKEIRLNPSQERLQALEDEIRRHFTMGMRGEDDKDFEMGDGEREFRSGRASMTTDSDWWAAYAFNHQIAKELVMPIADRVYKEVVAEYQSSPKRPEAVAVQEVSLQDAEEMTWLEGMRKVTQGQGIEKWSNGEVTLLLVRDRTRAVEWFRALSPQQKEELMDGVTHKVGEEKKFRGAIHCIHKKDSPRQDYYFCARPTDLGNPYVIGTHGTRSQVISRYEEWLRGKLAEEGDNGQKRYMSRLLTAHLEGKDIYLGCYCAPLACHTEVIRKILLEMAAEGK